MNYNTDEIITCLNKTILKSLKNLDEKDFEELGWDLADELAVNGVGNTDWDYSYGATKGVFIPQNGDYVIKIPFTGTRENYQKDRYNNFSITGFKEYCELEQFVYYIAVANGFSTFFAKTTKIGEVGVFSIYVQEKAEVNMCDWLDWTKKKKVAKSSKKIKMMISDKELKKIKIFCKKNKINCFNAPFLALIKKNYKKKTVLTFCHFIEKYTNDLHVSNLGFIKNKPVIIDYSGFYE